MSVVDIVIPVYKPDKRLFTLLDRLSRQTVPIHRIIIMNTEEKYFAQLAYGNRSLEKYKNLVEIEHLSKREFDHAATRNRGMKKSDADVIVMMTQDALPADSHLIEELLAELDQENTAVAYARQLPEEDCGIVERYMRQFNYPDTSRRKTLADLPKLGIKTYFCSDVCAAYRKDIFNKLGGFYQPAIFNEDMVYACKAMKAGYGVTYCANARVIHSHNYTCRQQFHRNFDLGVSQAMHPEVFEGIPSEKEGKKAVSATIKYLFTSGHLLRIPYFVIQCICKYAGYFLGKRYTKLPRILIIKCTDNLNYWN